MTTLSTKNRALRNRTLSIHEKESRQIKHLLIRADHGSFGLDDILNRTLCGDALQILSRLPSHFCNLVFADPPYKVWI